MNLLFLFAEDFFSFMRILFLYMSLKLMFFIEHSE